MFVRRLFTLSLCRVVLAQQVSLDAFGGQDVATRATSIIDGLVKNPDQIQSLVQKLGANAAGYGGMQNLLDIMASPSFASMFKQMAARPEMLSILKNPAVMSGMMAKGFEAVANANIEEGDHLEEEAARRMAVNHACRRENHTGAVTEGDIHRMFERLLHTYPEYKPVVLSRDPWVVVLDDFVSEEEAGAFVEQCEGHFERSQVGKGDVSVTRTSQQCNVALSDALADPRLGAVTRRVHELTQTPLENGESWQVVRYEQGQYYSSHHDQNSSPITPEGPRVYTVYLYLDAPEAGGGTHFVDLNVTVEPKRGRALIWPSVMDQNVSVPELWTHHEALPVSQGTKIGANLWVHQHDYQTPASLGCDVTRDGHTYEPSLPLHSREYLEARRAAGLPVKQSQSMQERESHQTMMGAVKDALSSITVSSTVPDAAARAAAGSKDGAAEDVMAEIARLRKENAALRQWQAQ